MYLVITKQRNETNTEFFLPWPESEQISLFLSIYNL